MPGKPKDNPDLTQQEEIALLKKRFIEYYADLPIKQAAADHIHRELKTINRWEKDDEEFRYAVLGAKASYAMKHGKTARVQTLLDRLYPELKVDKEADSSLTTLVTINHVHPDHQLPPVPEAGTGLPVPDGPDNN